MRRTIATAVFVWTATTNCLQAGSASSVKQFYSTMVSGIKSLKANVLLNLTAGSLKTKVTGQTILWRIDEGTVLNVTVDYETGVLQSASIRVSPPLHVWVMGNKGFSASLDSITYNGAGDPNPHFTLDNVPTYDPNKIEFVKRALRLGRAPSDLLTGQPFRLMGPATKCDAAGNNCGDNIPFITEVRLETENDATPGFSAVFSENATLRFSTKGASLTTFDNVIVVRDGSSVLISQLDYFVDDRSVFGVLDNFDVTVNSGVLNTKDMALTLSPGSRLQFSHVQFQKSGASSSIDAQSGQLAASVGRGSRINLQTTGNTSNLVLDDGSQLNLLGFGVSVDDQRHTAFYLGGGSNLRVKVASARFGIGKSDFFSLSTGDVAAQLQGAWDSSSVDGVSSTLGISSLQAQLDGGELDVNESSHLKLASGAIQSDGLELKSFSLSGLTGAFKRFDAQLAEDSRFGLPGSVQITTAAGASLSAADPSDMLTFDPGAPYPHGHLTVALPFKRLTDSEVPNFSLRDGRADFTIARAADGSLSGQNGAIRGTAVLQAMNLTQTVHFDMYSLAVNRPVGKGTTVTGKVKGSIDPGLSLTVTSDPIFHTPDHDNQRIYPITASFTIPAVIPIPEANVSFANGRLNLSVPDGGPIVLTPAINVTIPPGRGEHQQPDDRDDTADGTHGPDEDHHRQEVFTDTFALGCRTHIYAIADTYSVSGKLEFLVQNGVVTLTISQFQPDRNLAFDRDGCSVEEFLGVLGAVVGTVFGGPAGTVIGGIVGLSEGSSLDQKINALIENGIVKALYNTRKSWRFNL
jgi:hypothetical protein